MGSWWFNGLTLLAYLNYTPQLRYKNEDQIQISHPLHGRCPPPPGFRNETQQFGLQSAALLELAFL